MCPFPKPALLQKALRSRFLRALSQNTMGQSLQPNEEAFVPKRRNPVLGSVGEDLSLQVLTTAAQETRSSKDYGHFFSSLVEIETSRYYLTPAIATRAKAVAGAKTVPGRSQELCRKQ